MLDVGIVLRHRRSQVDQRLQGFVQQCRFAELLAGFVLVGEQRRPDRLELLARIRRHRCRHETAGCVLRRLVALAEFARQGAEPLLPRRRCQSLGRIGQPAERRPQNRSRLDAGFEHPGGVGQLDLRALVPCRNQPFAELASAARGTDGAKVFLQSIVAQHGGVELAQDRRAVLIDVLDQRHVGLQAEPVQHLDRRRPHELRKPGVEGADLDRPAGLQKARLQSRQRRCQALGFGCVETAFDQRRDPLVVRGAWRRPLRDPLRQALAHLARRSPSEGDGQQPMRLGAVEQGAQHARHQHPRLARTGAGLDHDALPRVAGNGVERTAVGDAAIDAIGRRVHGGSATAASPVVSADQ